MSLLNGYCPRCRTKLTFIMEMTKNGNVKTINYINKCPLCGYKHVINTAEISRNKNSIEVRNIVQKQY